MSSTTYTHCIAIQKHINQTSHVGYQVKSAASNVSTRDIN